MKADYVIDMKCVASHSPRLSEDNIFEGALIYVPGHGMQKIMHYEHPLFWWGEWPIGVNIEDAEGVKIISPKPLTDQEFIDLREGDSFVEIYNPWISFTVDRIDRENQIIYSGGLKELTGIDGVAKNRIATS